MKKSFLFFIVLSFLLSVAYSQDKNKGEFVKPFSEYWEQISSENEKFNKPPPEEKTVFKVDFTGMDLPKQLNEFTSYWYNEPVSQGNTGTCWAFSTTSYFESEVYRLNKKKVQISIMYTVYWEYVEKTKRYIRERGNSAFAEGSEANAVTRIMKTYGAIPLESYTGLQPGQVFHDHSRMITEMSNYLQNLKNTYAWNEEEAVKTIKEIMNHYIGVPPEKVTVDGEQYTPKEYFEKVLQLKLDDYVDVLSYLQEPFYKKVEYKVPDNWWHNKDYYNIPLDEFTSIIKSAIRNGYTLAIGGDVSEAGYDSRTKAAIIPTFDIPSNYIDDYARQFRFSNQTTGDDHGIHLVGYMTKDGKDWYLIKDSGAGSKNVDPKGYYFYHEDYVKLKIMDFMVHKDAVGNLLEKFK